MNFSQYTLRKKQTAMVCFLFLFTLSFGWSVSAHPHFTTGEPEHIEWFDVDITIYGDSSVTVKETIRYDFGALEKHGIYRDIPLRYKDSFGAEKKLGFRVESVTNLLGQSYKYDVSSEGKMKRIKIGDPDRTVSGVQTYIITYTVRNALGFLDGFDELYWNLTGNGWQVPIERVTLDFSLPQPVRWGDWRAACYYGSLGSTLSCGNRESLSPERRQEEPVQKISLDLEKTFAPGEGVTIAFGFPKGVVQQPKWHENVLLFLWENPFIFLPVIVFIVMFTLWWNRGRDPRGRGVIIPEYEVPENLTPLEITGLMRGKVTGKDIPAAIIDLAVKGYIRIEKTIEDRLLIDKTDYVIHKLDNVPGKGSLEKALLDALFQAGFQSVPLTKSKLLLTSSLWKIMRQFINKGSLNDLPWPEYNEKSIRLSDLRNKFANSIPGIGKKVFSSLKKNGFYDVTPMNRQTIWSEIILFVIILLFAFGTDILSYFHKLDTTVIISFFSSAIIYSIFYRLLPRVSKKGALLKERLLGLKEYLQIAEKNRLEFHNAPEKNPRLFERLLPAAMILGVSEIWAKEFADLLTEPPQWYSGPSGTTFSSAAFSADLGSFSHVAASTLSSSPGGSGGSGGGGSSGGGGGGGGGGSW